MIWDFSFKEETKEKKWKNLADVYYSSNKNEFLGKTVRTNKDLIGKISTVAETFVNITFDNNEYRSFYTKYWHTDIFRLKRNISVLDILIEEEE